MNAKKQDERRAQLDEHSKDNDLERFREDSAGEYLTSNQGVRINHTDDSLKAGSRGPTLMEDFHFQEKITHFDHERIPERIVHARGSAAHGYFQVYKPMAEYTKAKFLQDPSVQTPVFVRFSTVVGSRGSADTARDVRGFAVKFYTEDGNYDLVGNNMPVFFIQDAIKFPDLVHAIKPEPDNEMPQASSAHDTFWDFISLVPESMHMVMWVLSDRALPRSFRMMEGFGVHTFRFVDEAGGARFVKFHWKPLLGMHSLTWDESQKLAGKEPDWLRRDLWDAIEMGDFPEFELGVQIVEEEDEFAFAFDILDPTKLIPEELVPVQPIGKMVLNRNPNNFFAETEQVAFHPGHVVPGIDFTNDPLLQGRLFSYLDTQLIRLGGPNFAEIPINRPLVEVHNNQRDGHSRQTINKGKVSYFPNSLGAGCPMTAPEHMGGYVHYAEKVDGHKVRARNESFNDHFSQPTLFWNSMNEVEKEHIVEAFHFELGKVNTIAIRERMVELLINVDRGLAQKVAKGIGVEPPSRTRGKGVIETEEVAADAVSLSTAHGKSVNRSPALSMEHTVKDTIKSRCVAILAADGYNEEDVTVVKQALKEAGAQVKIVSKYLGTLQSDNGGSMKVDKSFPTTASVMYDAVLIPGGKKSIEQLKQQGDALHFVNEAFKHCKPIAALGEGVDLLMAAQVPGIMVAGSDADEEMMVDKGVITGRKGIDRSVFTEAFKEAIAQHRHWTRQQKDKVPA